MTRIVQVSAAVLGQARLDRYLSDCGQDRARAQQLFEWNLEMSGATYEALRTFEIILRNAMDTQLRNWNQAQGHGLDWLLNPDPRLSRLLRRDTISTALSRANSIAHRDGRERLHDDVLAQLTMGTWRYLLPSNSSVPKQRLWTDALSHAFPKWHGGWEPLVKRVVLVHELRNRVAHLEPLHRGDLRRARQAMRNVTGAVGFEPGRVLAQSDRMLPVIERLETILPCRAAPESQEPTTGG